MVTNVFVFLVTKEKTATKRTRANPTPATMEERVQNKENTTRALVDGDTQANSVKPLIAVCPIPVNMAVAVRRRKEALSVPVLPATGGHFATRGNHVIQTHATTEEDVCQHLKGSFADVRQDTEERHAQRKMNVSQIHVKTAEDAWHITLVVVSIVNVPWDSEGPLVKTKILADLIRVVMAGFVQKSAEVLPAIVLWGSKDPLAKISISVIQIHADMVVFAGKL